jgi:hypothetical protein
MIKFNQAYNMFLEAYLNEPFADKYDLNKIKNWSEKFLSTMYGSHYGFDVDRMEYDEELKRRHDLGVKMYQSMMPLAVEAINDLYTAEYKLHLLRTQYQEYSDKFNTARITHSLSKICDFLKEFIFTSMANKWSYYSEEPIPKNVSAREYLHNRHIHEPMDRRANRPAREKDAEELRGLYIYWSNELGTISKKLDSNDINDKIVGVTMMLNVFHDDNRGLVIAQPGAGDGAGEEYPELLIPLDKYEKASKINHRKVERELKQEIFGY